MAHLSDRPRLFWSRVDKLTEPCWIWQGRTDRLGYGRYGTGNLIAHRVAYEFMVGPIPDGLTLDHLCRNRRCVNPAHLEAVTLHTNILRGQAPAARNARKTHCGRGHEFTAENTYWRADGGRECRQCQRICQRIHRERRKETARVV